MTGKSLVINIDPTLSPVCIREVLEGMDQGDLVENALDAICRAHELQALFESTQVEQERSATYTDASDRHIVDLTDQIKARDLEIDGLRKEKEKNVAALDDVRKAGLFPYSFFTPSIEKISERISNIDSSFHRACRRRRAVPATPPNFMRISAATNLLNMAKFSGA